MKDFTIGADPEFLAIGSDDRIITPDNLKDYKRRLGYDGNAILLEIRPKHSKDPFDVVDEVGKVLKQIKEDSKFTDSKLVARPYARGYTMGGHIHFGGQAVKETSGYYDGNAYYYNNIGYLANYFGYIVRHLENNSEYRQRLNSGYGGLADSRRQNYGVEYRAPSSWIASPEATAMVLCLAKVVMFEYVNNETDRKTKWTAPGASSKNIDKFNTNWDRVTQMILYPEYKDILDVIPKLVKKNKSFLPSSEDIFKNWGLND